MANEVRITSFQRMIEKQLFPDNTHLRYSKNAGQPDVETIEIPQSSGVDEPVLGGVNSNYYLTSNDGATATALTPVIKINDKLTYSNNILRPPNPFVFESLQEVELSYNKASAIADEQAMNMNTGITNYVTIQWAPDVSDYIIPTTGKAKDGVIQTRDSNVTTGGYQGGIKRIAYEDIMALNLAIARQNLTGGTWRALPTPEQWEDILRIPELVNYEKTGNETMLKNGVIGRWGKILFLDSRQNDRWNANVLYDTTGTPVPVAYDGALNTNCLSSLLVWNDKYVERNEGAIKFFSRKNDPIYMGDISQWGVRTGGSYRRLDGKGVLALYESKAS